MKTERGYYDMLVQTCGIHHARIAVRDLVQGEYRTYTYSELYGVCEYISQNLQLLRCESGVIGVLTQRNIIVPSVIAAVHKNSPTFMFLDPTKDNSHIMCKVNFQAIISLHHKERPMSCMEIKPDREICVYDFVIRFYKMNSLGKVSSGALNEHSFIVSTSGSTGEPKHIKVPIRCIQPNVSDLKKMFGITCSDVIYFSTPLTFDPSMVELLLACDNGASLLLSPPSVELLWPQQSEHAVTVWQTTPSKFFQFSKADIASAILSKDSKLKVLALGGEPLNHLKQLNELKHNENKTKIFCLYGVTEMSCWASAVELQLDRMADCTEIPLGVCLSETDLDISLHNEKGPLGNILLGSASRKCSILNEPACHKEHKGKHWIDTGDVGEIKNGTIYYRGRTDQVIKRFGQKVNLQHIEKTVLLCPTVTSCYALWLPNPRILILYYTSDLMLCKDLQLSLKNQLDDKHMPDKIVRIDSMPLNVHGKICKNELAAIFTEREEEPFDHLKYFVIKELLLSLNQKLTYNEIKNRDYFSVGGTSFQAVALCNKIRAAYPQQTCSLLPSLLNPDVTIGDILKSLYKGFSSKEKHKESAREVSGGQRKRRSKSCTDNIQTCIQKKHCDAIVNAKMTKLWSYDTGKCVDATPAVYRIAANKYILVVGSHSGQLVVLNTKSGSVDAIIKLKSRIEAAVLCYRTNKMGEARGVVGTYDGTIVCFSLSDCNIVWKINVKSMIKSKATSANEMLYVASYDGNLRCIDFTTGAVKHIIPIGEHGISSDLVSAAKRMVVVATLAGVCAFVSSTTNSVVWRHQVESPIFASPVLYDDNRLVVFAEVIGVVHCHSVEMGVPMWKFNSTSGNIFSSLSIKKNEPSDWDFVFGCHDCNVYCLNVVDNEVKVKWKTRVDAAVYSSPCYFSNVILASSTKGKLNAIEPKSGTVVLEYDLPGETFSSPVTLGDQIFIGCRDNQLYSLQCTLR